MDREITIFHNELETIIEATLSNAKICANRNGVEEIKILTALIYRLKKEREILAERAVLEQGPGIYIKDIYTEEPFYDRWRAEKGDW